MISYFKNLKANKLQATNHKLNRGFTYVELIVVLSIWAVMSSIVIYNYGEFQAKIEIKSLASDIASKIVEAQKSAISGKLPLRVTVSTWKPSYGVYFNITPITGDNKSFIYFTDIDQSGAFDNLDCAGNNECLDKITITKNNSISKLEVIGTGCTDITNLSIVFKRPDSSAIMTSNNLPLSSFCTSVSYAQITITSPRSLTATIKIYPSGRVQVN
jgi:prepilin-type N-terminal cleavage/methylation domain-containing protein